MPIVDMSLEELRAYKGINPKPDDFDQYWERALDEMEEVDPCIKIVKARFRARNSECFDLYYTGVRNARIHVKYLRPRNYQDKLPAVLHFHGYAGHAADFSELLKWSGEGYAVFAMDCRGQAGQSEDTGGVAGNTLRGHIIRGLEDKNPDNLLFRHIFLDVAQLAKIVASLDCVDRNRIYATGGSQGGALTVVSAALSSVIKKAAPVYPFLSDYKRVWEMDMAERAYEELKQYFRDFDPRHEREEEIFYKLGYIDLHNMASRITAEMKFISALMDNVCPASTQFRIYNNLNCKKSMVIYPDYGHEPLLEAENIVMEFFMQDD